MAIDQLDTPCLVVDLDLLIKNIDAMQRLANEGKKALRPHVKTHKCSTIAKLQTAAGASGSSVAKLSEAEALVGQGITDVLITGPVVSDSKIRRLVELHAAARSLMVVADDEANIRKISEAAEQNGQRVNLLIDIDVGLHRCGVPPGKAIELIHTVGNLKGVRLSGFQAYAGQVQHVPSFEERRSRYLECLSEATRVYREAMRFFAGAPVLSAGGTGSAAIDSTISEVTEVQPGSYVFMDADYFAVEGHTEQETCFEPALTLLTTVVSAVHRGFVTVDAGTKSMYKDGRGPTVVGQEWKHLEYDWFGDEYGRVFCDSEVPLPNVGTVLQFVVSHCDPTVNQFDYLYVAREGRVVDKWKIDLRGLSQ